MTYVYVCDKCHKALSLKNMVHLAIYENYSGKVGYLCLDCYKKLLAIKPDAEEQIKFLQASVRALADENDRLREKLK